MGGLSSDQSALYLDMERYQSFSINYTMIREKSVWGSNTFYYIVRTNNKMKNITVPGWLKDLLVRNVRIVKFNMEPAVGQLWFKLDKFI